MIFDNSKLFFMFYNIFLHPRVAVDMLLIVYSVDNKLFAENVKFS